MASPPLNVESRGDVSDDENQAGKVTSRARLRTAELLQKPFDVRSIALTGLFILAVFYTIYFMRSIRSSFLIRGSIIRMYTFK
jgi:hypothetical protein